MIAMATSKLDAETYPELVPDVPVGLEKGLRNYWYPLFQSEDVPEGKTVARTVMGEPLVAWRDSQGAPQIIHDRCPHRGAQLSVGRVLEGHLQCAFHGLRFDGTGKCRLIPWEPEDSRLLGEVSVPGYPAEELGGYIWCYLGDPERFPPPPLAEEVPTELSAADEYLWFRLPTQVWDTNWLLSLDGGDAYHAVVLHAGGAQDVANDKWSGGKTSVSTVPLEDRRIKIVDTPHGIRGISVDREGKAVHHGHFTDDIRGDRFTLPCIHTNPIRPAPGAAPYAARLWQFPLDENRTWVQRFLTFRAPTPEAREEAERVYKQVALPRLEKVAEEDAIIAVAQGDLVGARSDEFLFEPDRDVVRLRRKLKGAFLKQMRGEREAVPDGALVFPLA